MRFALFQQFAILKLAVRNLLLHKLRSSLTMLGTILGAGPVIAMLAIGEGSKHHALNQIRRLGANNVILRSVDTEDKESLVGVEEGEEEETAAGVVHRGLLDLARLRATLPTIRRAVPLSLIRQDARRGRRVGGIGIMNIMFRCHHAADRVESVGYRNDLERVVGGFRLWDFGGNRRDLWRLSSSSRGIAGSHRGSASS